MLIRDTKLWVCEVRSQKSEVRSQKSEVRSQNQDFCLGLAI